MLAVQLMFGIREHCAIKEIIKQVLTKILGNINCSSIQFPLSVPGEAPGPELEYL